jgi:hypothetical protein
LVFSPLCGVQPLVEAMQEVKGTSALLNLTENFLRYHQARSRAPTSTPR